MFCMNKQLKDKTLTLFLSGEINSNNSEAVAKEIEDTIEGQDFEHLIFDFEKISYLSSAGLRIMLRYKQKYDLSIINVSADVYDVFQMTGFTSIMSISKILRTVEVKPDQIIGEGYFSTVYRIDKDTIVKVFKRASNIEEIEKEMGLAKEAFILGIPTAITFDIVRVGDKYGVQFEMLDSVSLRDEFRDHPEEFEELCQRYAGLLKTINTTSTNNPALPSARERFLKKVDTVKPFLTEEEAKKLSSLANGIKERNTFVHGDCHVKNILVQNGELFLIDMETLAVGDPVFEVGGNYATYICFEEAMPGNNIEFLGLSSEFCLKMFKRVLEIYLGGWDEVAWKKIQVVAYTHMVWWNHTFAQNDTIHASCLARLKEMLPQVDSISLA